MTQEDGSCSLALWLPGWIGQAAAFDSSSRPGSKKGPLVSPLDFQTISTSNGSSTLWLGGKQNR